MGIVISRGRLQVGQRVLVDRVSLRFSDPDRGDILVFKPPEGQPSTCGVERPSDEPCPKRTPEKSDTNFIKRVVGLPGDHLKVIEGSVYIDGKRQSEGFAHLDSQCPTCNPVSYTHLTLPTTERV